MKKPYEIPEAEAFFVQLENGVLSTTGGDDEWTEE